jgi:hypothetical protein
LIQIYKNDKHLGDVDGDADVLELLDEERGAGLGATTETKKVLTRTRKMVKRSRFKSL